ncbi:MAG: heparinase II/III domain-containing protein [Telluria sp.]
MLSRVFLCCGAVLLAGAARADWAEPSEPEAVHALPTGGAPQPQNPPAFSWSRKPGAAGYVLEVRQGSAPVASWSTDRNWYLPLRAFNPGRYAWRVRAANGADWSDWREFEVPASAAIFEVADNATLRAIATQRPRPRMLPNDFRPSTAWTPGERADRSRALEALAREVRDRKPGLRAVRDADWPMVTGKTVSAAASAQNSDVRQRVNTTARQVEGAALLFRLTGERAWLDEAVQRGDELAALDPNGPTSHANQDQGNRAIALALLKGRDLLDTALSPDRRQRWLAVAGQRTAAIYADLASKNGRLDQYPFDSHGSTNLGYLALLSALAVGDLPEATAWFDFSVRAYVNSVSPWGGPEGGFANGTAYAQYTADYCMQIWPGLLQATGVNLYTKPWSVGFLNYLIQFVPPGSPRHLFGDESENAPDFRLLKAYAGRFPLPQAQWYVRSLAVDEDPLTLLEAPAPLPVQRARNPAPPPNAGYYPGIGWAAMHSSLDDPRRTSVYFKSSPYGAYNHSHGDQNSFVLHAGGRPLLVATGSMDFYGSPLFNDWYRQTRAANGITYDGGVGQLVAGNTINLTRDGRITAWMPGAAVDAVAGDATHAYDPGVRSAVRRLWYLRGPNAVLVQDSLAADAPHRWEWNFHTLGTIEADGQGARASSGPARVCLRPLLGDLALAMRSGPPERDPKAAHEAHAAFVTPPVARTELLLLLDVGCKGTPARVNGRKVTVGDQTITLPAP